MDTTVKTKKTYANNRAIFSEQPCSSIDPVTVDKNSHKQGVPYSLGIIGHPVS